MSVSPKEIRDYCRPMLRRKGFRFSRLNGLLEEERRRSLEVARAFSEPNAQSRFLYSLRDAPESLSSGIQAAIDRRAAPASAQNGEAHKSRLALLSEIQAQLIAHGVYSEFGRPATAGLLLGTRSAGGMVSYFVLGEQVQTSLFCGRLTTNLDGRRSMAIFVTGAAARMMEVLDIWLRTPKGDEDEMFERRLMRADRDSLERFVSGKTLSPEETPFLLALNIISMRSCVEHLREIARDSGTPEEFVIRALNRQIDSVYAHETAHKTESEANGSLPLSHELKEILAYLLEAVHGQADDAFQSLLHRSFDFGKIMPRFESDVRARGLPVLLEGEDYLRRWALDTLDERFLALTGRTHEHVVDTGSIRSAQTSDYIDGRHITLLKKAMYNPSNFRPR